MLTESARIIENVVEGVNDLKPGDHVLPIFTGECEGAHWKSEESNMCDLLRINTARGVLLSDGKSRFAIKGQPIYHFLGTSTFIEYAVVHVGCIAKINPVASLDKVCVISCGILTGMLMLSVSHRNNQYRHFTVSIGNNNNDNGCGFRPWNCKCSETTEGFDGRCFRIGSCWVSCKSCLL